IETLSFHFLIPLLLSSCTCEIQEERQDSLSRKCAILCGLSVGAPFMLITADKRSLTYFFIVPHQTCFRMRLSNASQESE
ncbi:hypothetical protein EV421DRAFT_1864493, partial [Armillaria borealis]